MSSPSSASLRTASDMDAFEAAATQHTDADSDSLLSQARLARAEFDSPVPAKKAKAAAGARREVGMPSPQNKKARRLIELLAANDLETAFEFLNFSEDPAAQAGSQLLEMLAKLHASAAQVKAEKREEIYSLLGDLFLTLSFGNTATCTSMEQTPRLPSMKMPSSGDYSGIHNCVKVVLETLRALDVADMGDLYSTWSAAHEKAEDIFDGVVRYLDVAECKVDLAQQHVLELDTTAEELNCAVQRETNELGGPVEAMLSPSKELLGLLEALKQARDQLAEASTELAVLKASAASERCLAAVCEQARLMMDRVTESSIARAKAYRVYVSKHCVAALEQLSPMLVEALASEVALQRERISDASRMLQEKRAALARHDRLYGRDMALGQRQEIEAGIVEFETIEQDSKAQEQTLLSEQLTMWTSFANVAPPLLVARMRTSIVQLLRNSDPGRDLETCAAEARNQQGEGNEANAKNSRGLLNWLTMGWLG